jgi:hypothetical protein
MEPGQTGSKTKMIEKTTKFIHVGKYAAEIPVDLILDEVGWSPAISHDDALKIDRVRDALEAGDLKKAAHDAKVYELTAVA